MQRPIRLPVGIRGTRRQIGDEAGLVTAARTGKEFGAEVAALSARVDALGERIDRLAKPAPVKRR